MRGVTIPTAEPRAAVAQTGSGNAAQRLQSDRQFDWQRWLGYSVHTALKVPRALIFQEEGRLKGHQMSVLLKAVASERL